MKKIYTAPALRICGTLEDMTQGFSNGGGFPGQGHAYGHDKKKVELAFS